ncbi:MAG TPA: outer membrane lipoprotein-sorting protein [Verrucomicrobiota bacterium]|nr:outer membrane lipoprotein-sorting protein [Verrucomicrobiota bacterium]
MRWFYFSILALATAVVGRSAESNIAVKTEDGSQIAAELRNLVPASETTLQGIIKRRDANRNERILKIVSKIIPQNNGWLTIYEALNADGSLYEELIIIHTADEKNRYILTTAAENGVKKKDENPNLTTPFADSDFLIGDLGLEFFHWKNQQLIKTEMRKSRVCKVLESKPSETDRQLGYSRVVSWVDKETGGILIAEAYDNAEKKVKQFEVNSFKKDEKGNWQIEEIEIRNLILKTRTLLIFQP